ncbi:MULTISPECIES: amidohydrolase [Rhodococcus]|uniref:Amidohydrolase n=1 Tax=Rhodococcus qingshengii TaxID=334542 RepID=A0A2A5J8B8_RHOSG|nr:MULTISPECIES: amidohydrolase [Rhodococcus]MDV8015305.1 amidohydrolase [Rhodococcus sp. IEGM 1241]PCK25753.1 amidohydrolase [Rhodococcus qingshengii]
MDDRFAVNTGRAPALSEETVRQLHDVYRHLHAHPELSMQEFNTAELIESELSKLGIEHRRCAGTGVVGVLRNGNGPVVGYRADIDALPVAEDTGLEYASTATGIMADGSEVPVMHACGHDAHTAVALTLAEVMATHCDMWSGTIVFVFQPGEETAAGARAMVEDGLWVHAPAPEVIYGQHVGSARAGTILYTPGVAAATADAWKVSVHGRGSHASKPENAIDPIVLASHMIIRLQTIVAREVSPGESAVVTVGTIRGGLKDNIIPEKVEFTVNVRAFDQNVRDRVLHSIKRILNAESQASGAPNPEIDELYTFPRCVNDPDETQRVVDALSVEFGSDTLLESPPFLGSEDFGYLGEAIGIPSVYWLYGSTAPEKMETGRVVPGNHSAQFAPAIEPTLSTAVRAGIAALMIRLRQSSSM